MIRSISLPRRRAATTPPKMDSGTTMTKASAASLAELTRARSTSSLTGSAKEIDKPRSPGGRTRDPVPVLDEHRTIGAQPGVERVDRFLGSKRTQDPAPDIAREQLRADEDQNAQEGERDQRQAEAAHDELRHQAPPEPVFMVLADGGGAQVERGPSQSQPYR